VIRWLVWMVVCGGLVLGGTVSPAAPATIEVDFANETGRFRPLNGVNKGPLPGGGLIDLTRDFAEARIDSIRLHDCRWPIPDAVDIHTIFPDANADPALPASYRFAETDEYVAACRATGARIIYRLGESIEHRSRRRHVHPPADPAKWAEICAGIIRHYNLGWANGSHHDLEYWEIWNEPENRPAMWSGTDEQYFELYAITAQRLRREFPNIKIGGPAVGASGSVRHGEYRASDFMLGFLQQARARQAPLDFFSWHCYTADVEELALRAAGIRKLLDDHGFTKTESHLNEWNYLPDNRWDPLMAKATGEQRQEAYNRMFGMEGAVFIARALLRLQDTPLDMANLFHGELGGFGLFNEFGVRQKNYFALSACGELFSRTSRVTATATAGWVVAAGADRSRGAATILIVPGANATADRLVLKLRGVPSTRAITYTARTLNDRANLGVAAEGQYAGPDLPLPLPVRERELILVTIKGL
jgi:xylan 1,4-beta-xylosidase